VRFARSLLATLAAVSLAACRAPFEPTLDPPVTCRASTMPVPVTARGAAHVVYELDIVNRHDAPIRVTGVTQGSQSLNGSALAAAMRESGRPRRAADPTLIESFDVGVVFRFERLPASAGGAAPTVDFTIECTGWPREGDPFTLTASVSIDSQRRPVVLAPPVDGGDWEVLNGFAPDSIHRRHVNPRERTAFVAQRFAIDLVRVDAARRPRERAGTDAAGYFAFDAAVRSPADAVVVTAVDGVPDNDGGPRERAVEMTLANVPGNQVVLRIDDDGPFVLLAHLRQGSVLVADGDRVARGDPVGRIGSSGNSTEPHLHLHVADGPDPFYADGVPFVFETFEIVRSNAADLDGVIGVRIDEVPLDGDVLRFAE
jgi:hypothetical protein